MSFKRGGRRRVDRYDRKRLFRRLPHNLKSFDLFYFTSGENGQGEAAGLRQYYREVEGWLVAEFGNDPGRPSAVEVAAAGGLTMASWYEFMLRRFPVERRLVSVPPLI